MALVVALILLVVITLIGLAAVGGTIMQNKMAANQYDRQIAFQSSEAALRKGEAAILAATATQPAPAGFEDCSVPAGGTSMAPPANYCLANPFEDSGVASSQIVTVDNSDFNPGAVAAAYPQYIIQYLGKFASPDVAVHQIGGQSQYGAPPDTKLADYYRITARSGDPANVGDRAVVMLQETFRN
ncbi:MAG TPA: PilX N-terminal domain-containing pilus assembly protein [Oleiagrimonas sp.]|nr:PilX N-terminal domain-containing pilus assembly protein [Oleiagrimonas sp.]